MSERNPADQRCQCGRAMVYVGRAGSIECPLRADHPGHDSAPAPSSPVADSRPTPPNVEWEAREGMVTVYDDEGHYLGCMGTATWAAQSPAGTHEGTGNG